MTKNIIHVFKIITVVVKVEKIDEKQVFLFLTIKISYSGYNIHYTTILSISRKFMNEYLFTSQLN